ncbi:MAG: hypothetical protein EA426_03210 [Spirochaetaceae bacterium]|nr:MAG: hypothetical protein EA426_03210 [Spirochaetaceae bacterium]
MRERKGDTVFLNRYTFLSLLVLVLTVVVAPRAEAQMDMLPQIFRDLPPEMQQGLPAEMSHLEYRQLNRNVDFFSMFMSMFVPGYAMFQVERPELGWTIAGARAAGYGMMAAAIVRQWNAWRDLRRLESLSDVEYQRYVGNAFLFGGGIVVSGMTWAFDVIGAYHIAKSEKDFVIYKYGLRESLADAGLGETGEIEYIRRLVLQDSASERRVREELEESLRVFIVTYPESEFRGEVEYYAGSILLAQQRPTEALVHFTRQIFFFADEKFSPASRRHAIRIVHENRRRWSDDWELLISMLEAEHPAGPGTSATDRSERVSLYLTAFEQLESDEFRRIFVDEALRIAHESPSAPIADFALHAAASQLARLGEIEEAVIVFSTLAGLYPDSEYRLDAVVRVARLLDDMGQTPYAERFYRRVIEWYPESPEAEEAEERLTPRGE